ncbi:MAG TPA: hypothetical protein VE377_12775 [Candidatus Dormibacteraeota bacterium]|nr:hypothetical protein [Candidatus Dormibacteraeota bacterium]
MKRPSMSSGHAVSTFHVACLVAAIYPKDASGQYVFLETNFAF